MTSHQLFLTVVLHLAQTMNGVEQLDLTVNPVAIPFEVHSYAVRSSQSLEAVALTSCLGPHCFDPSEKHTIPRKQSQLPFGLKMTDRVNKGKRKQKATASKAAGKEIASSSSTKRLKTSELEHLARGCDLPEQPVADLDGKQDHECSPAGSSSNGGSTSDSSASEVIEKVHREPAAKQEGKLIRAVAKSHKQLMQRRGLPYGPKAPEPVTESDAEAAAPSRPSGLSGPPVSKVYCHPKVGLVAAGVQVHRKLATCRHCSVKIDIGCPRFQYSFSKLKFSAWIHADCLAQYLRLQRADIEGCTCVSRNRETEGRCAARSRGSN